MRESQKPVIADMKFECFTFEPHFQEGSHCGKFRLIATDCKHPKHNLITGVIKDIYKVNKTICVETEDEKYLIDIGENVMRNLDNIKRYLIDENYSSSQFYHQCISKLQPTEYGWKVF